MMLDLGDRMKRYEKANTTRISSGFPICVRIDGRSFSKFTKGTERPYDQRISDAMETTTKYLVKESAALVGYCQSDEISLVLYQDTTSQVFFDGKVQKLVSVLASLATVKFYETLRNCAPELLEGKNLPVFDCRVWIMPSKQEVINYLIWRSRDAIKNSVSMAVSDYYPASMLHKKTHNARLDMLLEKGINWNAYPPFFKEGAFFAPRTIEVLVDRTSMPPEFQTSAGLITTLRSSIQNVLGSTKWKSVANKIEVVFDKAPVVLLGDSEDV